MQYGEYGMRHLLQRCRPGRSRGGFTITEVLVASAVGSIAIAGLATVFIWCVKTAGEGRQYAWAQTEALISSRKIMGYMRNASGIDSIDQSGNWVQLNMPDDTVSRFEYVNDPLGDGNGRMAFVRDISSGSSTNIISQGLTKVMTMPTRNVFAQTGDNTVRVCYRVTEPLSPGECPAEIEYAVFLRNAD